MGEFRFFSAGESHGPGLTAHVEGLPAGLEYPKHIFGRTSLEGKNDMEEGAGNKLKPIMPK